MGRETERKVLEHLRASGGVIGRAEALAIGLPPSTLKAWVRLGRLVRVGTGIYVQPAVLETESSLLRAATTALDAIVSHESAARLHGLDGLDPRRVTVSVPVRKTNRFDGVTIHQMTDLTEDQTTVRASLPTTDVERTVLDLAAVLPKPLLEGCLDQLVRLRKTTYQATSDRLEETARKGKPGVAKLRAVMATRLGQNYATDSVLETRLLRVLTEGGLPHPDPQYRPAWLRQVNGRVDFAYVEQAVVVEGDSQRWHGAPDSFQADRKRDNLAQLAGWVILRFTWHDITERPDYVVETVADALMKRSRDQIRSLEP